MHSTAMHCATGLTVHPPLLTSQWDQILSDGNFYIFCALAFSRNIQTCYCDNKKEDPIYLQLRILDFIDNFFYNTLDKKLFDDYKKGLIDKKKSRDNTIHEKASSLAHLISDWSQDRN